MGLQNYIGGVCRFWGAYARLTRASILTIFAIAGPVAIGSVGMALDMSQAYLVRERLSHALDAAALAAAMLASTDEAAAYAKLQSFMDANYPSDKIGVTYDLHMSVEGDDVRVWASADYETVFLRFIGIDEITVDAETVVQREVQGLEVVLVLDNTGSMSTNNNIRSLKEATTNFINILFGSTSNPEYIKIGLVPYSNSVRVGQYGLGQTPEGDAYADGDIFVTLPNDVAVTTNHEASSGWYGCVVEHNPNNYDASASYVAGSKGQLWKSDSNWNGHGWNPRVTSNDPYPSDVLDDWEGPWDIYQYGTVSCTADHQECTRYRANGQCRTWTTVCDEYSFNANAKRNEGCPYANIVPLTSDKDYLLEQVEPDGTGEPDDMEPHGNTLGNIGMVWGGRVLSPEAPFTEAYPWDNNLWRKAIVMMTDGDNTENGTYSSFWFTSKNQMNVTKFNQKFAETCEVLKEKGVVIYTITFTSAINADTKSYYENCASSSSKYFDAPTQTELIETFDKIANELSNLRIKE